MRIFVLLLGLGLAGCSEPFVTIPGGKLDGALTPAPASWGQVPDTVQLETRPEEPYSINIWAVAVGGNLYVSTSRSRTWTGHMEADPRVRVRIGGKLYELLATRVRDHAELRPVAARYEAKYSSEQALDETLFYRLSARR